MVSELDDATASSDWKSVWSSVMVWPFSSWRRAKTTSDVMTVVLSIWNTAPVSLLPCCFLMQGFSWRLLCSWFCTASRQKGMLQIDNYMFVHERMHVQVIDSDLQMWIFFVFNLGFLSTNLHCWNTAAIIRLNWDIQSTQMCLWASKAPAAPLGSDPMMQLVSWLSYLWSWRI